MTADSDYSSNLVNAHLLLFKVARRSPKNPRTFAPWLQSEGAKSTFEEEAGEEERFRVACPIPKSGCGGC